MDSWNFGRPLAGYRWDVANARGSLLLLHGYGEHVGPTFVLGHSLGGLVAARGVLRNPHGLRGVVLSSPALIVGQDQPALLRAVSGLVAAVAPRLLVGNVTGGILSRREEVDTLFKADPLCYQGRVQARSGHEMMRGGAPLWPSLAQWTLPTLVLHGDADRLITIEGSRRFARGIASPDKELWEVGGGYHELFNDLESEAALRKLTEWLLARS